MMSHLLSPEQFAGQTDHAPAVAAQPASFCFDSGPAYMRKIFDKYLSQAERKRKSI
jgi:hypothetical protein